MIIVKVLNKYLHIFSFMQLSINNVHFVKSTTHIKKISELFKFYCFCYFFHLDNFTSCHPAGKLLPNFNNINFRLCRICVPGVVHDGDVDQNVCTGTEDLFRVLVQPI